MAEDFLEALKHRQITEQYGAAESIKPRFVIDFTSEGEARLSVVDEKGRPCRADYRQFCGPVSTLLRSIAQIRQSDRFNINWGLKAEDSVSIPENRHLVYQLLDCPEIFVRGGDGGITPLQKTDKSQPLVCRILLTGKPQSQTFPVFLVQGEQPRLLTDSFAIAQDRIARIDPVGENFLSLRHFQVPFREELLERYLSVLCSTLDNVRLEIHDLSGEQPDDFPPLEIVKGQPLQTRATLVIERVDEDGALYLRVVQSASGLDPDFLRDFQPGTIAQRTGKGEITIRPLESIDIDSVCADLLTRISKSSPSKAQAKEIWRSGDTFIIPSHTAQPFLFSCLPSLARDFRILGAEKLKGYKIRPVQPSLKLRLGSGIDFLEADASIDVGGEIFTLSDFLKRYRKDNYIVLSDGDKAIIDENYIRRLERLFSKGKKKDGYKVSFFDLPEVAALLDEIPRTGAMERSRKFYEGFNSLSSSRLRLNGVKAELRPYQKEGAKWLNYLYDNSMGGCLADDMGLGKTIQTIALLCRAYGKSCTDASDSRLYEPTLIVMPKSLIFNWQTELERFAPHLSVYAYYGQGRDAEEIRTHQVILTSYGMVRSDIETLKDIDFHMVILDESQNIRNTAAQMTQAVLMLRAGKRFALSGTPVENNLTELYSLFRFLNPAMLGTLQEFTDRYAGPIHKDGDAEALEELRRKIYPFLLRRTKGEVLQDLPERIDQKIYVDMDEQHASFYEQRRRYFWETVHQGIEEKGVGGSQFVILQALGELRRIASIPESMSDGAVRSSKIPVLMESLEEAVANRHKVVVFFNFIAGIEMVGETLASEGIGYAVMTGSTQDRESVVRRFQEDESCRVLLMTLKTGGVGLNLTAADTVFIFEPWWNKAEEEQAIGRLHRIGQKSTVMSFSIITRGTIEEKICLLQEQKSQLVDALISSDGKVGKSLSEEEIDFILK